MTYRPWGPIDWVLSLSTPKDWHFIGVIGTEERSLASWEFLRSAAVVKSQHFTKIEDVDSIKYRDQSRKAHEARKLHFERLGGNFNTVESIHLMSELFEITALGHRAQENHDSIVLDITSFPKRFFFLLLRQLINSVDVRNLLLTYTSPEAYTEGEPLYENIESWKALPGFGAVDSAPESWIISIGFLVESLVQHIKEGDAKGDMNMLIPFPAPLSALNRTWKSVANLEESSPKNRFNKFRTDTLNISAAFDRICSLSGSPAKTIAFAPFGPKPISAAMCLYAIQRDSSVFYPQPTVYHPSYSTGILHNSAIAAVNGYWIKHDGQFLYSL